MVVSISACDLKEKDLEDYYILVVGQQTFGDNGGVLMLDNYGGEIKAIYIYEDDIYKYQVNEVNYTRYVYYYDEIFPHYNLVNKKKLQLYLAPTVNPHGYFVRASDVLYISFEIEKS